MIFQYLLFIVAYVDCKTKKTPAESSLKSEKSIATKTSNNSSEVREKRNLQNSYYGQHEGGKKFFMFT